jgi:hypothetical protein
MANQFILIPEDIYRGLTTSDTGNINLDWIRHELEKTKQLKKNASTKNINYNQELRRYLSLRNEMEHKPVNVAVTNADEFSGALINDRPIFNPSAPATDPRIGNEEMHEEEELPILNPRRKSSSSSRRKSFSSRRKSSHSSRRRKSTATNNDMEFQSAVERISQASFPPEDMELHSTKSQSSFPAEYDDDVFIEEEEEEEAPERRGELIRGKAQKRFTPPTTIFRPQKWAKSSPREPSEPALKVRLREQYLKQKRQRQIQHAVQPKANRKKYRNIYEHIFTEGARGLLRKRSFPGEDILQQLQQPRKKKMAPEEWETMRPRTLPTTQQKAIGWHTPIGHEAIQGPQSQLEIEGSSKQLAIEGPQQLAIEAPPQQKTLKMPRRRKAIEPPKKTKQIIRKQPLRKTKRFTKWAVRPPTHQDSI